ncbi:phospholipase D family protein [Cupriavidus malaysiensis]|uniref:Phospholipase D family protein n=1 Tax=Cupriavidus malaysiensis TaxID=367825 RepID=A0ABN4TSY4_9BURK|nr:phospholipase D family protein [Cupriavidus malaysiensis]AOZ10382.1 phospholipase D family protein [Cupriavidus malaysiensis]
MSARLAVLCATFLLAACASLPRDVQRTPSHALGYAATAGTPLGEAVAPKLAEHPGDSLFYPMASGPDALAARLVLARAATRTLDLQYYAFDADASGTALIGELLAAADRGVRVRLLLDDLHTDGHDALLAALDAHPRIQVRLFNPFANRGARWMDFIGDFHRLDRRMHNKAMIADNQFAIVGGRNVSDAYFAAAPQVDFSDLDLLAAGPVVPQVSAVFDDYWNSAAAYPAASLIHFGKDGQGGDELDKVRRRLAAAGRQARTSPYVQELLDSGLAAGIRRGRMPVFSGRAAVIADRPDKVLRTAEDNPTHAINQLAKLLEGARHDLALVSPYFVPGEGGTEWLAAIARRGVHVRILTNSFAATDIKAVHAAYAPYRRPLLEAGVELYELKPSAYGDLEGRGPRSLFSSSRATLHAKGYMVDQHLLFVGSLNLDMRSARLNTEMGIVLDSAALCEHIARGVDPNLLDMAYKVELRPPESGPDIAPDSAPDSAPPLAWTTREHGLLVTYDSEPGVSVPQQIGLDLLRLLTAEREL